MSRPKLVPREALTTRADVPPTDTARPGSMEATLSIGATIAMRNAGRPNDPPLISQSANSPSVAEIGDRAFCDLTGTKTPIVALHLLAEVVDVFRGRGTPDEQLTDAMALLGELEPQNAADAMLGVHMIGTHRAITTFLSRAFIEGAPPPEGVDRNINRAVRLMRLYNEQLEASAKLRGKSGQQRVVVEHVTVNQGGQATVGALSTANGGATNRQGMPCRAPAMRERARCRLHGGLSTGPRTPEGRERAARANRKHGQFTAQARAERALASRLLREAQSAFQVVGYFEI